MTLTTETKNGVLVLLPRGRIDHRTVGGFGQALMSHVEGPERATPFVVNFAGVDYINSEGLRILLFVSQRLAEMKGPLVLCEMKEHIGEVFQISGFDKVMMIADTEADALTRLHP